MSSEKEKFCVICRKENIEPLIIMMYSTNQGYNQLLQLCSDNCYTSAINYIENSKNAICTNCGKLEIDFSNSIILKMVGVNQRHEILCCSDKKCRNNRINEMIEGRYEIQNTCGYNMCKKSDLQIK